MVFEPENTQATATIQHLIQTALVANLPAALATVQSVTLDVQGPNTEITVAYTYVPDGTAGTAIIHTTGRMG